MNEKIIISCFALIFSFTFQLQATECNLYDLSFSSKSVKNDIHTFQNPNLGWKPTTSVYFEFFGKFFPSINVDFRKRENLAISIGTGLWFDNEEHKQTLFIPSINAFYFLGKKKRFEIGGGTGPFLSTYEGYASHLIFGNIGYRYQKKKGLIFRSCFTPFIGIPINNKSRFMASPWIGVSLGYSF